MTDQSDYCSQKCKAACCYSVPGPPFGADESLPDDTALSAEVKLWREVPQEVSADVPCPWLDLKTGCCLHYDDRPEVCGDVRFPVGDVGCQLARAKRGLDHYDGPGGTR